MSFLFEICDQHYSPFSIHTSCLLYDIVRHDMCTTSTMTVLALYQMCVRFNSVVHARGLKLVDEEELQPLLDMDRVHYNEQRKHAKRRGQAVAEFLRENAERVWRCGGARKHQQWC